MTKPKKRVKAQKTKEELEAMTSDETMQYIFGTKGHQVLKEQAVTNDDIQKSDYRLPPQ